MKDKVNQWIAVIIGYLYECFPQRVALCPSQIDKDADLQTQQQISDLIVWLSEEGIIRFSERELSGCFLSCTLTMKGFLILNSLPDPLKQSSKLGEFISQVAKEGSINAVNQAVNFLLNHLLKGGLS